MGIWDKVSGVFFHPVEDDAEELQQETAGNSSNGQELREAQDVFREPDVRKNKKGQVIAIPGQNKAVEMILVKAERYDDMQNIAKHIKDRRIVIVNFEDMPQEVAQRMVDFLSGAVFALDGVPKKVSGATFVFSSSQVDLEGNIMGDELAAQAANAAREEFGSFNFFRK
ncbi:MAG: cell division protein SepF [Clostridiales bacterium]